VTVTPGPITAVTITPTSATVRARASHRFEAAGTDSYGNPVQAVAAWSLGPPSLGTIAPRTGPATTFTAGRTLGSGTVTAAATSETGTISAAASVTVTPGRLRIGWIKYRRQKKTVVVNVRAVDAAGHSVSRAVVSVLVRRDGRRYLSARAVTGAGGRTFHRVPAPRGGCFTTTIRRVSAAGFVWDGRTPRNRFCKQNS
jgi:hypothetical protein